MVKANREEMSFDIPVQSLRCRLPADGGFFVLFQQMRYNMVVDCVMKREGLVQQEENEGMCLKVNKHREPGDMPQEIRLAYAKILSLMLTSEPHPESTAVVAFYQAIQALKLKERDRRAVLEFMLSPDTDTAMLCRILMETEREEERNLLRFSLLEDLYWLLMADHYEGDKEAAFLIKTAKQLAIRQEHIDQVRLMYKSEHPYLPTVKKAAWHSKVLRQTAAGVAGLWIPLGLVAGTGEPGLTSKGIVSGLRALSPGHGRSRSIIPGLMLTLAAGAAAWQSARWLLHLPEWRREWMLRRLRKAEAKQLLEIEKEMEKDIQMLLRQVSKRAKEFQETESWQALAELLRRSKSLAGAMIQEKKFH